MHTLAVLHPPTIDIAVLDASVESKHSDEGERVSTLRATGYARRGHLCESSFG